MDPCQTPDVRATLRRRVAVRRRLNDDTYAAVALTLATVAALVWSNVGSSYATFWGTEAGFTLGDRSFRLTLGEWVDEGIMSIFFFMVGLDVRHEFTLGELRQRSRAVLPVASALGGLVVPAVLFGVLTRGQEYSSAWGAVISTDTAFALGLLAVVGPRRAPRLRLFLLTLAVVDDIGALVTIAIFYTTDLDVVALALAFCGLGLVWLLQRSGVWRVFPYLVVGIGTWGAMFASGVHATLAGVLLALLMPVHQPRRRDLDFADVLFRLFRQAPSPAVAGAVRRALVHAVPLNQRLTAVLPPYVNFAVVPLFALANAGVTLSGETLGGALTSSLTWGIVVGLVVGKTIGITAAAAIVQRWVPSARLPGLDLPRIAGVGALSGMGFTISLLIVGLAVPDPAEADHARVGVLLASLVALATAWCVFRVGDRLVPLPEPEGVVLPREVDLEHDHVRGSGATPVTVVVYAAMNTAYRQHTAEAVAEARRILGNDVRVVFRHRPEDDATMTAALALEAAAVQGRFWDMHDALVEGPADLDERCVVEVADRLGLDADALARRVERTVDHARVEDDAIDLDGSPADGRPVLYVHGRRLDAPANAFVLVEAVRAARPS